LISVWQLARKELCKISMFFGLRLCIFDKVISVWI
jgi:hypothetical protein